MNMDIWKINDQIHLEQKITALQEKMKSNSLTVN